MKLKFNIGDKIIAIRDSDSYKKGDIHEVADITAEWVYTNGDTRHTYNGLHLVNFMLHDEAAQPESPAIDWTKPVETRTGKPFTLLSTQGRGKYPVNGYVEESEQIRSYTLDGKYIIGVADAFTDLRNVSAKPLAATAFINLYANGLITRHGTRDAAEKSQEWREFGDVVGRKLVTVVAGEFD